MRFGGAAGPICRGYQISELRKRLTKKSREIFRYQRAAGAIGTSTRYASPPGSSRTPARFVSAFVSSPDLRSVSRSPDGRDSSNLRRGIFDLRFMQREKIRLRYWPARLNLNHERIFFRTAGEFPICGRRFRQALARRRETCRRSPQRRYVGVFTGKRERQLRLARHAHLVAANQEFYGGLKLIGRLTRNNPRRRVSALSAKHRRRTHSSRWWTHPSSAARAT